MVSAVQGPQSTRLQPLCPTPGSFGSIALRPGFMGKQFYAQASTGTLRGRAGLATDPWESCTLEKHVLSFPVPLQEGPYACGNSSERQICQSSHSLTVTRPPSPANQSRLNPDVLIGGQSSSETLHMWDTRKVLVLVEPHISQSLHPWPPYPSVRETGWTGRRLASPPVCTPSRHGK